MPSRSRWFVGSSSRSRSTFVSSDAREHGPVLLPAAELGDRPVPVVFVREADAAEDALDFRVERVAVGVLVIVLQLGVLLEQPRVRGFALRRVGEIVLDRAHLLLDAQNLGERGLDEIEQRHPRLGVQMLADVTDRHARRAQDLAAIGLFLLEEQPEQRRLPRAIAAHEPDVLAGVVLPRHALQDIVRSVAFLDVFKTVEHRASKRADAPPIPATILASHHRETSRCDLDLTLRGAK